MDHSPNDASPVAKVKREIVSKYPRLDSGFPVASLDPEPIQLRDKDIDAIWRESVQFFKMYLNDIVITFDKINLQFHRSSPSSPLNIVREAILKRLAFDGVKTGNIGMQPNQHNQTMELTTRGHPATPLAIQKEIFSLIAVVRPPDFSLPPQKAG